MGGGEIPDQLPFPAMAAAQPQLHYILVPVTVHAQIDQPHRFFIATAVRPGNSGD